jgi:putative regulator of septum formation
MTEPRDPGDAPDANESLTPTGPTPPAPPPYAPGDPAAYPPPGPTFVTPPGPPPDATPTPPPGPQGWTPPGPMGWAPPPMPKKQGSRRGIIVLGIIVAVIVVLVIVFRDRLSGNVADLSVGDCFDQPASLDEVSDIQHQPCNGPHDSEVFLVFNDTATGLYPERQHFRDLANVQCTPAATAYLATDFMTRLDIDYGIFFPLSEGWSDGDREVTCYFSRVDEAKLNGTVKNIGTSPLP